MNTRNLETFHYGLIAQYKDLIHEAILESEIEHKSRMDLGKLNDKLKMICQAAHYDGLPENLVNQLIEEAVEATPMSSRAA